MHDKILMVSLGICITSLLASVSYKVINTVPQDKEVKCFTIYKKGK